MSHPLPSDTIGGALLAVQPIAIPQQQPILRCVRVAFRAGESCDVTLCF